MTPAALEVLAPGPFCTVQDRGRPGRAELGVSGSGAADRDAYALANRLLANAGDSAALELVLGGLRLRARGRVTIAVTGAVAPLTVDGHGADTHAPVHVPDGAEVVYGAPTVGLRSYLAVRGGIATEPVLGSRSTDVLAGLGVPLDEGDVLPVGPAPSAPVPAVDVAPVPALPDEDLHLRALLGPRDDWFRDEALRTLGAEAFVVSGDSNRVGMRLEGPTLERAGDGELPSEGVVPGAIQVPSQGQPVLFLADHPVTGGYPVVAVVEDADLALAAQARPGQRVRFRLRRGPAL